MITKQQDYKLRKLAKNLTQSIRVKLIDNLRRSLNDNPDQDITKLIQNFFKDYGKSDLELVLGEK